MQDKNHIKKAQQLSSQAVVEGTEFFTPHDEAIFEAGKTLLLESIKTGRDFCQFMITTCIGAIPVYLALIAFLLPKDYKLGIVMGIVVAGPAVLFLIATLVFVLGYFPTSDYLSLALPEEIEKARDRIIARRLKLAMVGFAIFATATFYAIAVFIIKIGAR